jgi:hypothetical protein
MHTIHADRDCVALNAERRGQARLIGTDFEQKPAKSAKKRRRGVVELSDLGLTDRQIRGYPTVQDNAPEITFKTPWNSCFSAETVKSVFGCRASCTNRLTGRLADPRCGVL